MVFPHRACGLPQALRPFRYTVRIFLSSHSEQRLTDAKCIVAAGVNPAATAGLVSGVNPAANATPE